MKSAKLLEDYSKHYLVIDFDHLFISTCLRDEFLLLIGQTPKSLINKLSNAAEEFNIKIDIERKIINYSGGEKALISCLFIVFVAEHLLISQLKLLLV